jgi:hypothetical protein
VNIRDYAVDWRGVCPEKRLCRLEGQRLDSKRAEQAADGMQELLIVVDDRDKRRISHKTALLIGLAPDIVSKF